MTKLSVIIPCYNCERYIRECLDSVLEALVEDDEVICVDDGSSDHTLDLLREISDPRLHVIAQRNSGPGGARNAGIDAATGDQILFVDADDVIAPALIQTAKLQPEGSLASRQICMKCIFDESSLEKAQYHPEKQKPPSTVLTAPSKEARLSLLNAGSSLSKWIYRNEYDITGPIAKTYCREILVSKHVRFPDNLSWGEDLCFNLQYLRYIEEIHFVPVNAYWYRKVPTSLTNRFYSEKHLEIQRLLETAHAFIDGAAEKEAFRFLAVKQYFYSLQYDFCNKSNPDPFSSRKKKAWAFKEENPCIEDGIKHCQARYLNAPMRILVALVRLKWFAAIDITMKAYTELGQKR